ncbi:PDZ domain-containing protein [Sporosarcina sp. G11-34]|uniref:PDZ domain-containing protein n=1 Tax=Sporosarcina sp. G11-34 TaxID=2849605 RepID=UPI0022A9A31B|nr:PDZ domain-containing protein [Sporosarcina sp. G11-34]MCZ2259020.1 PDZ domain-containing protein [Sporosarcina sp. G11-34]
MKEKIVSDLLQAVAFFFLNPIFIMALLAAVLLGYYRVKRERRSFNIRLLPGLTELKLLVSESLFYAFILSVVILVTGLVVDPGWLVLFVVAAMIALITFYYKIASPIYFAAGAFIALYFLGEYASGFTYLGWVAGKVDLFGELAITVPVIAGLLLVVEGRLINRYVAQNASPFFMNTKRGLQAVAYKGKRLWLLPVLFLIPGDMISAYVPYWPQFTLGETLFTFVPVPIIIGFSQVARSTYADLLFPKMGRAIALVGVVVIAVGFAALWMPMLGWAALGIGVAGRAIISIQTAVGQRIGAFAVAPISKGVVIAGIIPNSPAEKMGLVTGECIRAVNGRQVSNEKELYAAIQVNAAHCRLQVLGRDGEVRLMQQVIFRHDHHRLGLLVVR